MEARNKSELYSTESNNDQMKHCTAENDQQKEKRTVSYDIVIR